MWQKLKEQIPSIVVLTALIVGGSAIMFSRIDSRQRNELAALQAQNKSLRDQADEDRHQAAATAKLVQDALKRNPRALVASDEPMELLSDDRLNHLADLVATRIEPKMAGVKSAGDMEQLQRDETDRIAGRLTDNLRPMLTAAAQQNATLTDTVRTDQEHIEQLNENVRAIQAAAQDAVKLLHEISALYLDSFKDQGVLVRLLSLPGDLIQDTVKLNLVTSRDRAKFDRDLSAKMNAIEKRLSDLQASASKS